MPSCAKIQAEVCSVINLTTTGGRLSQFQSIKSLKLALIYLLWASLPRGEPLELEGRTYLQSLPYIRCAWPIGPVMEMYINQWYNSHLFFGREVDPPWLADKGAA